MSDAMGYYYDTMEKEREEEIEKKATEIIRCYICNQPINYLSGETGICGYCDFDLNIHRRMHEFDYLIKRPSPTGAQRDDLYRVKALINDLLNERCYNQIWTRLALHELDGKIDKMIKEKQ